MIATIYLTKSYLMLQNIKFTAFTVYELLRKNLARERENTQA